MHASIDAWSYPITCTHAIVPNTGCASLCKDHGDTVIDTVVDTVHSDPY